MAQNDSSDMIEKWRDGIEFSSAWHKFADPYALGKFRDATSREALQAEQILMVAELWAALRNGELQAIGKCVKPEISNGPVSIPEHMFEFRPPIGIENSDDIEISGWRYEGVKVIRVLDADIVPEPVPEPELKPVVTEMPIEAPPVVSQKRSGGRPDTYSKSADVLRILFRTPSNIELSAGKLHAPFVIEFQRLFPRDAYKMDAPSPRTFQDQLARFRKELAETGNN